MAILKHIANKNSNYGKALEYLMFQHNEYTQELVHDAAGHRILRKEYWLDGLNCDPFSFDKECEQVNASFRKNYNRNEIKSHHYIISFDPKDVSDHGLTGEKAQEIGMGFASKYFAGHQALVCTHTDGHNESGNMHVHIIINSVRKLDIEKQDYMERDCDSKAGYKHHLTDKLLTVLQSGLMEICEREGLNQVDLLSPSKTHITDEEYWLNHREQEKLNQKNAAIAQDGMTPSKIRFQSQKQYLRDAVRDVTSYATSVEHFESELKAKYGILLKKSRGRYSYLHPDRDKYMTSRTLGTDTDKDRLERLFILNQNVAERKQNTISQDLYSSYSGIMRKDPLAILYIHSELRLVVDLQNNIKAQQSAAYAHKVKLTNLQQLAKTVVFVQEHGFDTEQDLSEKKSEIIAERDAARRTIASTDKTMKSIRKQIHFTGQYLSTKSIHRQFLKAENKAVFRREHQAELDRYNDSVKFFKDTTDGNIPSLKDLKTQLQDLQTVRERQQSRYDQLRAAAKEISIASKNVDMILSNPQSKRKTQEQELNL